ncbi:hypothetical protein Ancab_007222 [Ancistrocladus abbreviatus]
MQFFDINIPYLEGSSTSEKTTAADKSTKKSNRLKLVVKAMEFGYSGIAYNRTIRGVMSESDRCSIALFPLSSLLKLSPSLSSSASFHRRLLGVSTVSPFRQYTRLTVLLDTSVQASALNSANPILKTYDLIAVRPLNQNVFDQACQFSEVDLISIDFSEKLPFRLKLPMIKAAIARGVYFEITYLGLIEDAQVRRQVISNAKLLVEWTRGKNLIVSSAAPSVLELRGPNDVANVLSLLGLSIERAKVAVSKNCRSLIENALRKKHFYKEAIRIEAMPSSAQSDPKEPWILDSMNWDPISSGEGDLLLEDLANSFTNASKICEPVKAIDFTSVMDMTPSQGLQVKDFTFRIEDISDRADNPGNLVFTAGELGEPRDPERAKFSPGKQPPFFCGFPIDHQVNTFKNSQMSSLPDSSRSLPGLGGMGTFSTTSGQEPKKADSLLANVSQIGVHDLQLQESVTTCEAEMLDDIPEKDTLRDVELNVRPGADSNVEMSSQSKDCNPPASHPKEVIILENHNALSGALKVSTGLDIMDHSSASEDLPFMLERNSYQKHNSEESISAAISDGRKVKDDLVVGKSECFNHSMVDQGKKEHHISIQKEDNGLTFVADGMTQVDYLDKRKSGDNVSVTKSMLLKEVLVEGQTQRCNYSESDNLLSHQTNQVNGKVRRRSSRSIRLPFKRLLEVSSKKRAGTIRGRSKRS